MLRNVARQSPLNYYSAVNRRPLLPLSLRRHCSSKRGPIEMEFDFSSPNELKKMEETIQKFIVHKATPDWLPFIPGASFWVPPSHGGSKKVVDLIDKLSHRLPKEEEPSITTDQDAVSSDGIPNLNVELKSTEQEDGGVIEVVVYMDSKNVS